MDFEFKDKYNVYDMVNIVKALRADDGCPWDKVQTHESIRRDFIEEVYEAVEAIDEKSVEHLREELGDVLFQVVFHTVIESEKGNFQLDDVADEICKKMIIRHPHVFGDLQVNSTDKVLKNWDTIKMQTKSQKKASESLQSVSKALPSLIRCDKLQKKSQRAGIPKISNQKAIENIERCLLELKAAVNSGSSQLCEEKTGELLFSVSELSGNIGVDCEKSLYNACENFTERFKSFEDYAAEMGIDIQDSDAKAVSHIWNEYSKK